MDQVMRASTELSAIVPEVWAASFYPTLLEALPFNDLVSRDYEGVIQNLGDTVHITSFPQFDEAYELAEDEANDADGVTASGQSLVINKRVVKDYIVTSRAQRQSLEHASVLRDLAMFAIMKKMQSIIIETIVPSASAPDHQISYDSVTTLALADLLEGKELLDDALVPDDGMRAAVMDSQQWNDLFNITGFVSRDFIPAGSPLTSGTFATPILGFKPKMTTEASDVTYLFHPQFMSLAVQELPEVNVYDLGGQGKRAERVNVDVLFGVKQLSDIRVVSIS